MGLKSNTTHKMQKLIIAAILFFVTITNASPLVQNKQLGDAETAIRTQLTNFFESENVENAKDKAKEVSDKIVKIFDDSRLTVQERHRHRHRQTQTDTYTDTDRQRQTETDRDRQRQT